MKKINYIAKKNLVLMIKNRGAANNVCNNNSYSIS